MATSLPTPSREERKSRICTEWLYALDLSAVMSRWENSGELGFYNSEKQALYNHPDPMVRVVVQNFLETDTHAKALIANAKREVRAQRQQERQDQLARLRELFPELNTPLHGTLEGACLDAATRYIESNKQVKLSDCITIAAQRHLLAPETVLLAMAGDGARAIYAAHDQLADSTTTATEGNVGIAVTTTVEHYRSVV